MNNNLLELGKQVLESQSFSRLVGTKLIEYKPGEVELEIPIKEDLLQQNNFVHGGVLSYAADNALTFAGGSVLGPEVLT
ncbi:MAG TPA: PaaI family thioesterase, partial [Pseudogracilibacillus sp.]|nr:PaaI family thioesterase [Pseudogracilibacillus sp.]